MDQWQAEPISSTATCKKYERMRYIRSRGWKRLEQLFRSSSIWPRGTSLHSWPSRKVRWERMLIKLVLNMNTGHWEEPEKAHGDKRNSEDLERWRGLAKIGTQIDRHILPEQATLNKIYGMFRPYSLLVCVSDSSRRGTRRPR